MAGVASKLGIKPGARIRLLNAPADGPALIGPLPPGAAFADSGEADVVVLFASDSGGLRAHLPTASGLAGNDGLLWLAYPKGSSGVATDLSRDALTPLTDEISGLTGVALVSVDATWSAMRLRPSARYRT